MPTAKQPPEIQPQTPGAQPEQKAPEQKAPEQKAPEAPPAPTARDLLFLDMEVTSHNIADARTSLSAQQNDPAKAKIESALRSLAFLETSLPSSRASELIQRALVQISQGLAQPAAATIKDVASLLPQVGGLSNPQEAAKLANDASSALGKNNADAAKKALDSLASKVQAGQQEALLAGLKDHLRGAQYAIYRNAISVAKLELDEADGLLGQLRTLTDSAWPATKA
jgi:hypothetical protein